jgi:hypothetical protein
VPNAGVEEGVPKREDEDWAPNMVMCDGGRWDEMWFKVVKSKGALNCIAHSRCLMNCTYDYLLWDRLSVPERLNMRKT